jgi:hypothetical protein
LAEKRMPKYINGDELISLLRNDLERWGNYTAEQNPYNHAMRESVIEKLRKTK